MTEAKPDNQQSERGRSPLILRFLGAQIGFLCFQPIRIRREDRYPFLVLALLITWAAGFGRYWDAVDPGVWQRSGLVSVGYVFGLGLIVHTVAWPFYPKHWTIPGNWLFAAMTALPAWLYAIPVERFMEPEAAIELNEQFLLVVALWRVALLIRHLAIVGGLGFSNSCICVVFAMCCVLSALSALGLESVTFEIMAHGEPDPADQGPPVERGIAKGLACLGVGLLVPSLLAYVSAISVAKSAPKEESEQT